MALSARAQSVRLGVRAANTTHDQGQVQSRTCQLRRHELPFRHANIFLILHRSPGNDGSTRCSALQLRQPDRDTTPSSNHQQVLNSLDAI